MRPPKTTKTEWYSKLDTAKCGLEFDVEIIRCWQHAGKLRSHCRDHRARVEAAGHSCEKLIEPTIVWGAPTDPVDAVIQFEAYADELENLTPYATFVPAAKASPGAAVATPSATATVPQTKQVVGIKELRADLVAGKISAEEVNLRGEIATLETLLPKATGRTKQAVEANLAKKRRALSALTTPGK